MTSLVGVGEFYERPLILWPRHFNFDSYRLIFGSNKMVRTFGVTAFVTLAGTLFSMTVTSMIAYGMSKKTLPGRKFFMLILTFTMFFSGGLIPYYLLIRDIGLINKIWVMIIPAGVSVWNFIILKSHFQQMPESLEESAKIDGANDLLILFKIVLPLSLPIFVTFSLFNAVGFWNTWFDAMIFIQNRDLHPLQLVLRQMLIDSSIPPEMAANYSRLKDLKEKEPLFDEGVKMATVIVATVPILFIYPWLQKYFEKGVLIGSIRE